MHVWERRRRRGGVEFSTPRDPFIRTVGEAGSALACLEDQRSRRHTRSPQTRTTRARASRRTGSPGPCAAPCSPWHGCFGPGTPRTGKSVDSLMLFGLLPSTSIRHTCQGKLSHPQEKNIRKKHAFLYYVNA